MLNKSLSIQNQDKTDKHCYFTKPAKDGYLSTSGTFYKRIAYPLLKTELLELSRGKVRIIILKLFRFLTAQVLFVAQFRSQCL